MRLLLGGASKQKPAGDDTTGVAVRVGEGGPGETLAPGSAPALSGKLAVGRGVTAGEVATGVACEVVGVDAGVVGVRGDVTGE